MPQASCFPSRWQARDLDAHIGQRNTVTISSINFAFDNDQAAVSIAQEAHKIAEINLQVRLKIKQAIQQRSPKRLSYGNCCELLRRCAPLGQLSEEC
jgi:hypothetical protein